MAGIGQFSEQYNQLMKLLKKLPVFESGEFHLTSIDDLITYDSSIELDCIVFGLVRRDPSRIMDFLIEDPTGKVPIIFQPTTNWREWATLENSIYLVEGSYDSQRDSLLVKSIGLPPPPMSLLPEPSSSTTPTKESSIVIILSHIYLDQPKTFEALKFLFTGYSQSVDIPQVFVLMGNFVSKHVNQFEFKGKDDLLFGFDFNILLPYLKKII